MFGGYLFLGWLPESLDPQLGVSKDYSLCLEAAFFWAGFPRVWIHNWGFPKIIGDDVYGISFRHLSDTFLIPLTGISMVIYKIIMVSERHRKGIGKDPRGTSKLRPVRGRDVPSVGNTSERIGKILLYFERPKQVNFTS